VKSRGDAHAATSVGREPHLRVEQAADELYASPLNAFVDRRQSLAKALRDEGDPAGAKRVGAMAKPSVSAWAVNQLWWSHRGPFEVLFRSAQSLLERTDARPVFEAQVRAMRDRARDVLVRAGHGGSAALLRRVATTLHAIAAAGSFAPDAGGRLVADRDPPGFEAMEGVAWATKEPQPVEPPRHEHARPHRTEPSPAAAEQSRRAAEAKERAILEAKRELDGLRRQLSQTQSVIAVAQADLEALAAAQTKIDAERERLQSTKAHAEHQIGKAQARIEEIERSLRRR
jgi:hypothetical protein